MQLNLLNSRDMKVVDSLFQEVVRKAQKEGCFTPRKIGFQGSQDTTFLSKVRGL